MDVLTYVAWVVADGVSLHGERIAVEGMTARQIRAQLRAVRDGLGDDSQPAHFRKTLQALKHAALSDERLMDVYCWHLYLVELLNELHGLLSLAEVRRALAELEPPASAEVAPAVDGRPSTCDPPDHPALLARLLTRAPSAPPAGRVHHVRSVEGAVAA